MKKISLWILALGIGCGLVVFFKYSKYFQRGGRFASHEYKAVTVVRGDINIQVQATGTLQPENRVTIKPPISVRIESVEVDEGEHVKKGQLLAWMSSTDRAALLDSARAKGPQELAYWEDLYKPIPLISPITGNIITVEVEPGQTLSGSDTALVMSDRLIVEAQVDETDLGEIALNQEAEFVLDAYPKEQMSGKVSAIAFDATTVNNVTMYLVKVNPRAVAKYMRSGMNVTVNFKVAQKKAVLLLPLSAVRFGKDQTLGSVWVADRLENEVPHSRAELRSADVKLGLNDGKFVEISEGLQENTTVFEETLKSEHEQGSENPFTPFMHRKRDASGAH